MDGVSGGSLLRVAVDLLILSVDGDGRLALLLSRREKAPYAGCWALPGCFVGYGESAEASAGRLLNEMLPLQRPAYMEQLYTFTDVNRDPRGRVISIAYLVIVPWLPLHETLEQPDARMNAFRVERPGGDLRLRGDSGAELRGGDLAFDHSRIIATGLTRLQGKLDYTEIAFHFLCDPESFTLGELQTVYEAVLGSPVDSSNFRRTILSRYEAKGRIAQTERSEKKIRGRPAALYRIIPPRD